MRFLLMGIVLLLLSGCGAEVSKEIADDSKAKDTVETVVRTDEKLEDLLKEIDFETQLTEACPGLKVEMTTAYLEPDSKRPSIVGFCHHNGEVSKESDTASIATAIYNDSDEIWKVDIRDHEFMNHPYQFSGNLKLNDGSERVVIELYEDNATFGLSDVIVVSAKDDLMSIERTNSTVTQIAEVRTEENKLIFEDDHIIEIYTYNKNNITRTEVVKDVDTNADLVITYNKINAESLFGTFQSGTVLDVKVGDKISFKPEKALSLADFQIRTGMESSEEEPDTFIVSEIDIGNTIEFGEYPYNEEDMIVYYIGDPYIFASRDYLNELKKGIMPGSSVQLSTPNSKIKSIMKDEFLIQEFGMSGANHLVYENFIYAIPFLEEEGDIIYSVIRKLPFSSPLTGDDFIKSWGEPDNKITDMDSLVEAVSLVYEFSNGHYVTINLNGNATDSKAVSISLF